MIMMGLLAAIALPRLQVVEDPSARQVIVQAWVPAEIDDAGPDWALLGRSLLEGTQSHTRAELLAFGSQSGRSPRVSVLPDLMRIEVAAPAKGLDVAMGLLASIVREPLLDPVDVQSLRTRSISADTWTRTLWPSASARPTSTIRTLRILHARCFRPERLVVSVGGAITSEQARLSLVEAFGDWRPAKAPPTDHRATPPTPSASDAVVELRGPVCRLTKEDGPIYLASIAMGVGKAASLHRVLREEHGLTYRQEAIWWPTRAGWRLRFLVARQGGWPQGFDPKSALLADAGAWAQGDIDRAVAVGAGGLAGTFLPGPVWLDAYGPIDAGLADRVAMSGYRELVGGVGLTPADLAAIDLVKVREAAEAILGN